VRGVFFLFPSEKVRCDCVRQFGYTVLNAGTASVTFDRLIFCRLSCASSGPASLFFVVSTTFRFLRKH
jgi:hypothetical protein